MRKFIVNVSVLLLAALLVFASGAIKQNSEAISSAAEAAELECETISWKCLMLASVYKDVADTAYALHRQEVSASDLPIVRIYMSDGAIAKLDAKRRLVLGEDKPNPILISEPDDWVNATIIVDDGDEMERSKVALRLKGDWADHLVHPTKLSYRIKTRSGGYLFGMQTFSIQNPRTRVFEREPQMLHHMREHGILGPRYRFVDVWINDYSIGIMALEEHFTKEMLEAQNRRDGPIFALDEDPLWDQWDINYNGANPIGNGLSNFTPYRDTAIKDFRGVSFQRGSIPTNNTLRGHALLRDFYLGRISAREAFDYDQLSKFWVLTNVWRGCHSAASHNRRHYFNPISGLLEPVSFDNVPVGAFRYCVPDDVRAALSDPLFREKVVAFAEQLGSDLASDEFAASLLAQWAEYDRQLRLEDFHPRSKQITPEYLLDNLNEFRQRFEGDENVWKLDGPSLRPSSEGFVATSFFAAQDQYANHLTAFYYPLSAGHGRLAIRNITPHSVEPNRFSFVGRNGRREEFALETVILPPATEDTAAVIHEISVPDEVLSRKGDFVLEYLHRGEQFELPVEIQFENYDSGYSDAPIEALEAVLGVNQVDRTKKEILISAGQYTFLDSIAVPIGWQTIVMPGVELNFEDGSLLKLQGPLDVRGTEAHPVIINVDTNLTFRDMGSWGGVFVSKSAERSQVSHLVLNGTGTQNLNNRQGFFGMTGCLSFFDSDVTISNSTFNNAQCEDALNIVKSDFVLDNVTISKARADAFDSDFSTGVIRNSLILDSGNDGVDVSGTSLRMEGVRLERIGDKAVSVGEKSELSATGIDVDGAVLGVASKDLSRAVVSETHFENISGTALITYIKKPEYGVSSIDCQTCTFGDVGAVTGRQDGTTIIVNGREDRGGYLTQQQVVDTGLAETG